MLVLSIRFIKVTEGVNLSVDVAFSLMFWFFPYLFCSQIRQSYVEMDFAHNAEFMMIEPVWRLFSRTSIQISAQIYNSVG